MWNIVEEVEVNLHFTFKVESSSNEFVISYKQFNARFVQ
jgi:hypothetical protein